MTNGMAVKNAWCVKGVTSNRLLLGMTGATQGTAQRKLDRMLANIADEDPTLPEDERGGPIMGETQYVVVPITITEVPDTGRTGLERKRVEYINAILANGQQVRIPKSLIFGNWDKEVVE